MTVQAAGGRNLWLLTLTAPSERAHRRWTPAQLYVRGAPRQDCDCHVGVTLADWNPGASGCWNRLRTALSRDRDIAYYRATEVQDGKRGGAGRGALHHHVVLATTGPLDVAKVQAEALAAGYGCVIDLRPVEDLAAVDDVAGYVSKTLAGYVSKSSGDGRQEVPWRITVTTDPTSGEELDPPARLHSVPTYRTHTQSQDWGCTVKEVRAAAQAQARRRALALAVLAGDGFLPDLGGSDEPLTADVGPPT